MVLAAVNNTSNTNSFSAKPKCTYVINKVKEGHRLHFDLFSTHNLKLRGIMQSHEEIAPLEQHLWKVMEEGCLQGLSVHTITWQSDL